MIYDLRATEAQLDIEDESLDPMADIDGETVEDDHVAGNKASPKLFLA